MPGTRAITAAQRNKNKINEVFRCKCGPLTNESVQNVNFRRNLVPFLFRHLYPRCSSSA